MSLKQILIGQITLFFCLLLTINSDGQSATSQYYDRLRAERQRQDDKKSYEQREQQKRYEENAQKNNNKQKQPYNTGSKTDVKPISTNTKYVRTYGEYAYRDDESDYNGLRKVQGKAGDVLNKWGLIDKYGKVVVALRYEELQWSKSSRYLAKFSGRYGFISKDGKMLIPFEYEWVNGVIFDDGSVFVIKEGKQLRIDASGKIIPDKTAVELLQMKAKLNADSTLFSLNSFNIALAYEQAGNFERALLHYKRAGFPVALANHPINLHTAICIIEDAIIGTKENYIMDNAKIILINYQKAGGADLQQYYYQGLYQYKKYHGGLYEHKDPQILEDAIKNFNKYVQEELAAVVDKSNVYQYLGHSFYIKEDYEKAIDYYLQDARFHPPYFTANNMVSSYLKLNKIEKASMFIAGLNDSLNGSGNRVNYSFRDLYYQLAWAYGKNENYKNGLFYIDSALNLSNRFYYMRRKYYAARGYFNYMLGNYQQSIQDFNLTNDNGKLVGLNAEVYYFEGKANFALRQYSEACMNWRMGLNSQINDTTLLKRADIIEACKTCPK